MNRSSGSDRWKYRASRPLRESPSIIENTVFLPEPGVGLVALDAISGKVLWRVPSMAQAVTIAKGRLLLNEQIRMLAVDPASGKTVAQVPVLKLKTALSGPDNSLILVTDRGRLARLDPVK